MTENAKRVVSEELFTDILRTIEALAARVDALEAARVPSTIKKDLRLSEVAEPTLKLPLTGDARVILDADKPLEFTGLKAGQLARVEFVVPPEGGGFPPRFAQEVRWRVRPEWSRRDGFAVRVAFAVTGALVLEGLPQYGDYLARYPHPKGAVVLYPFAPEAPLRNVLADRLHLTVNQGRVLEGGGVDLAQGQLLYGDPLPVDTTRAFSVYVALDFARCGAGAVFSLSSPTFGRDYVRLMYNGAGQVSVRPSCRNPDFNVAVPGRLRVQPQLELLKLAFEADGQWQVTNVRNGDVLRDDAGRPQTERWPKGNRRFVARYPERLRPAWGAAVLPNGTVGASPTASAPRYFLVATEAVDDDKVYRDARNTITHLNPRESGLPPR